jgi:hypothetical protein
MEAVKEVLDEKQTRTLVEHQVPAELPKGFASFHHPLMMHGSYGNTSVNQRRATVVNVMREGVLSNCAGKDMGNFPTVPTDQPMTGPCYPALLVNGSEEEILMAQAAGSAMNPGRTLDLDVFQRDMDELQAREAMSTYKHRH